jgi:hypothetical protein
MSSAAIFDLNQSHAAVAFASLICSIWAAVAAVSSLLEDNHLLLVTNGCLCQSCRMFRNRHRSSNIRAHLLAVLCVVPAEGIVGGFIRSASLIGVLGFVLIALGAYRGAERALRRE